MVSVPPVLCGFPSNLRSTLCNDGTSDGIMSVVTRYSGLIRSFIQRCCVPYDYYCLRWLMGEFPNKATQFQKGNPGCPVGHREVSPRRAGKLRKAVAIIEAIE